MENPIWLEGALVYVLTVALLLKMLIRKSAVECAREDNEQHDDT